MVACLQTFCPSLLQHWWLALPELGSSLGAQQDQRLKDRLWLQNVHPRLKKQTANSLTTVNNRTFSLQRPDAGHDTSLLLVSQNLGPEGKKVKSKAQATHNRPANRRQLASNSQLPLPSSNRRLRRSPGPVDQANTGHPSIPVHLHTSGLLFHRPLVVGSPPVKEVKKG